MRRLVATLVALVAFAPAAYAGIGSALLFTPTAQAEVSLFAGGGTQLSNGAFFPGTAFSDGEGGFTPVGPPLQVPQGSNIRFRNLDPGASAGSHKVTSFKRTKRAGKSVPLFTSKTVAGPGEDLIVTSHLKPGTYAYYCSIHGPMLGLIEVK